MTYDIFITKSTSDFRSPGFQGLELTAQESRDLLLNLHLSKGYGFVIASAYRVPEVSIAEAANILVQQRPALMQKFPKTDKDFDPQFIGDNMRWWKFFLPSTLLINEGFHPGGAFVYVDKLSGEIVYREDHPFLSPEEYYIETATTAGLKDTLQNCPLDGSATSGLDDELILADLIIREQPHAFPGLIEKTFGFAPRTSINISILPVPENLKDRTERVLSIFNCYLKTDKSDVLLSVDKNELIVIASRISNDLTFNSSYMDWENCSFLDRMQNSYQLENIDSPITRMKKSRK